MPETILIVDDPCFDRHVAGVHHPERPDRLAAARQGLFDSLPPENREYVGAREVRDVEAERVHHPGYLQRLWQQLEEGTGNLDPDTGFSPGTAQAVRCAAGSVIDLCDRLLTGPHRAGVALTRPPGHHARPDRAMGFCLLNHVAIAAAHAVATRSAKVAVFDWDAHHGNGTQEIFYSRSDVLYVSFHQTPPFYPNSGMVEEVGHAGGAGYTVNFPLSAKSGPPIVREVVRRGVLPIVDAFAPDLLLVSCGLDAHRRDPLTDLGLDDRTFGAMTTSLLDLRKGGSPVPTAFVLEGGYDLQAIEGSMRSIGQALQGQRIEFGEGTPEPREEDALDGVLRKAESFWPTVRTLDGP